MIKSFPEDSRIAARLGNLDSCLGRTHSVIDPHARGTCDSQFVSIIQEGMVLTSGRIALRPPLRGPEVSAVSNFSSVIIESEQTHLKTAC
jgi:hypothetical protein